MNEKLRMAKMDLPDCSPDQILCEVQRLYWRLQRLPGKRECGRQQTPAYLQIEAAIRDLSAQYMLLNSDARDRETPAAFP